jgi:hypothetical protein
MPKRFNPTSNHPFRAVQAWQILIGLAMNRQTTTYDLLALKMYRRKAQGVLAHVLGHIAFYCRANRLPDLNCIVVGAQRGTAGSGIPRSRGTLDQERERVYRYDWYGLLAPTAEELAEAYQTP